MDHLIRFRQFRTFLENMEKSLTHEAREKKLWDTFAETQSQAALEAWKNEVDHGID